MSSGDFFGPALPPDFNVQSPSTSENASVNAKKRGRLRNASDSSHSSADQRTSQSDSSSDEEKVSKKISQQESCTVSKVMGPALPPGFASSDRIDEEFIGPVIPISALGMVKPSEAEDDMHLVGPLPDGDAGQKSSSTLDQLEARAKHMRDKLLGTVISNY
jgi:hypothetical protein